MAKRIKKSEIEKALSHNRNGVVMINMPDGELKCQDFECVELKAGDEKIPGFRVKSTSGRWYSLYIFSLINDIPFSLEEDEYIIPDEFRLISKNSKLLLAV